MTAPTEPRILELRDQVAEQEAALRVAVRDLEDATRRALTLRHHFAANPWLWTAGALLAGAWIRARR